MRGIRVAAATRFALALLLAAGIPGVFAARGESLEARLDCPDSVGIGEQPRLDLRLENRACEPQTVRVLSMVVGNGGETVGGVEILGPAVAARGATVPAATDLLSGACIANQCEGSYWYCTSDLDCICRVIAPAAVDFEIVVPTPLPAVFEGSVVEQLVFTDKADGTETTRTSCLISVPEPAAGLQLAVALVTIALLRGLAQRVRNPREDST